MSSFDSVWNSTNVTFVILLVAAAIIGALSVYSYKVTVDIRNEMDSLRNASDGTRQLAINAKTLAGEAVSNFRSMTGSAIFATPPENKVLS